MKLSIMMLTLNSEKFFNAGVLTALKEAVGGYNYELLIVDGGSVDGTIEEVVRVFGDKATVFVLKDRNLALCRNFALEKAPKDADFYCWVDSDIVVPKDFFSRLIPLFKDPTVGTAEIRALLEKGSAKNLVGKYYRGLKGAETSGVKEAESGATTCLIMRPEVAHRVRLDSRFKRAGEDVSLHYQVNEMGYKTFADFNDPPAWHVRPATVAEEIRRLFQRGEARSLNLKLHSKAAKTSSGVKRALFSSTLTWLSIILLVYGLWFGFLPAIVPIFLLLSRQALKLKKPWRIDFVLLGFVMSIAYLTGFLLGFLKYWLLA